MNKLPEAKKKNKGFTLVEMVMVVLAIIALVAIVLLWWSERRPNGGMARAAVCMSNLHHIYIAASLYANEYNRYPGARYYTGESGEYENDTVEMSLPAMLCPKFGEPKLFWCPAESKGIRGTPSGGDTTDGEPHPFWERQAGSYLKMKYGAYEVDGEAWAKNENNERLAWGTCGSTYGVPMSIGNSEGKLPFEECLGTQPRISYGGTIDLNSVGDNPEALYMVDHGQWWKSDKYFTGVELWQSSAIPERHKKVNYLTFGGSVERKSKDWLTSQAAIGEEPWYFKWSLIDDSDDE